MRKLVHLLLVSALLFIALPTNYASAEACGDFANGCSTGQHCQIVSIGANNEAVYSCIDNLDTNDCRSDPSICPAGTQCVSSGGFSDCVLAVCQGSDPTNSQQTCSCTEVGGGFVWQCNPRFSGSSGDYVCYDYVDGQCVNWIDTSSTGSTNSGGGAPSGSGNLSYVPLEPLPGITYGSEATFGNLLRGAFRLLIALGGMVAVLMLVLGGIAYMTSEAVDKTKEARNRIFAALWGLFILISSVLILNTINPQLLNFRFIPGSPSSPSASSGNIPGSGQTGPTPAVPRTDSVIHTGATAVWPKSTVDLVCAQVGKGENCPLIDHYFAFPQGIKGNQEVIDGFSKLLDDCDALLGRVSGVPGGNVGEPSNYRVYTCTL